MLAKKCLSLPSVYDLFIMKKVLAVLLLLAWTGMGVMAQIPNGYYDNANGKTGDDLKVALHDIIDDHTTISYAQIWNAFWSTDNKGNGVVWDMYSDIPNGTPPYTYQLGQHQCGSYEQEGDCYNREHSWPQSWFGNQATPTTDLHHIFPTDGYVNAERGNYPFGEVGSGGKTYQNGSKRGPCKSSLGYNGTVFEPIDAYKGDFARALMYMSVRYYGEDGSWGSSGMTNKSVIKDWAIDMLLDWCDLDPVSQKEIDRNNVIYNQYQHNRNPFIDHPEYARMIWDENWQGGTYYAITCATGLSHGSISALESAMEGTTVAIVATPSPGYMVSTYSVYKTGDTNTTVEVSSNGTFTMPGYAVTVSATFVENNTYYAIALGAVSHGSISASATSAKSGTTINLTAMPATGYSLYSWYVFKTGDMNATVNVSGNSFVMPAYDVTVMATFVQGTVSSGDYVKVTSALTDWSGDYLIVYENGRKAFDGSLTVLDANNNTISVTINNSTISSNNETDAAMFTIAPVSGGYSVKSASGKYIGNNSTSNGLTVSSTALVNTISFSNGNVSVRGTQNTSLQYNNSANRFRYYASTQNSIQLYKKSAPAVVPTHSIHFNPNGGTGSMNDQTVNEFEPTALQTNTFTREGFVFEGWNTAEDGTGDYYADGATVTLLDDLTLYAQWNQLFTITLAEVSHGSISASLEQAFEENDIILTAVPDPCYALDHWIVTDILGDPVTVTENMFEMPASNVTVSAVFRYSPQSFVQEYQLVTSTDQLVAGHTYLIVNVVNSKALGTTQNNNNRSASAVTIEDGIIPSIDNTVCELVLGAAGNKWTFFDAGWGNNGGYLYAASSNDNLLKTQATNNTNGQWNITFGSNGIVTLKAQGGNTRNLLKYNNSNNIFSCYASGQLDVCLFRRTEIEDYPAEQMVSLEQGWNWWAPTIEIARNNLEAAIGFNLNTLPVLLVPGQMYKIESTSSLSAPVLGVYVASPEITIEPGCNWIGYYGEEALINLLFNSGFVPVLGDKIISQDEGFAIFNGASWDGTLTVLRPGHGYVYISNSQGNRTLSF